MQKKSNQLSITDTITNTIIGMSDGIVISFAMATGVSRVLTSNLTIVSIVSVIVVIGAIATGISGYIAGKGEGHHYDVKPNNHIYKEIGLTQDIQDAIAAEDTKDKELWQEYVSIYGLPKERPALKQARTTGVTIAIAYMFGGILPMSPYLLTTTLQEGFIWSVIVTLISLCIFGFFKANVTGRNAWVGALQLLLIGSVSGLTAYYIAGLFIV